MERSRSKGQADCRTTTNHISRLATLHLTTTLSCCLLLPVRRQRQVLRAFSPCDGLKIFRAHILHCCATNCLSNDVSNELSVRDDSQANSIMHQIKQVVLRNSATDALYNFISILAKRFWSLYLLFMAKSLPFRILISYRFRSVFSYRILTPISCPRLVIV